jgi:hypothetical protein
MRILLPASLGLALASSIATAMLWSELRSERKLISELRTQLADAKLALATKPAVVTVAAPAQSAQPPGEVPASSAAPAVAPTKITREAALAVLTEDSVKRQKSLLADAEYRKALVSQARTELQQRYAGLRVELGLTEQEQNALFDLLADAQMKMMTSMAASTDGTQPDPAVVAAMQAQGQQLEASMKALLGPERYAQFEEYERVQPSRTRVQNLSNLLGRSGRPLSDAQTRSLMAAMVTEQKRMEAAAQALRDAGQTDQRSPAEIQAETNRRLLGQVPTFLDDRQVQLVRGRFEERATIDRAADRVQQREREVLQQSPGGSTVP